ncbi:MAG: DUF2304 domain-containing protein [Candidatus Gracilibacteria bacterium]|jgi:hypothetical protein
MIGIQLLCISFACLALFFTFIAYKRKDFNGKEMLLWMMIWVVFLGIAIFPQAVSPYIQNMGFTRLMDFVVVIAFVVLFALLIHNYLVIKFLQKRIEKLVREEALKDLEK